MQVPRMPTPFDQEKPEEHVPFTRPDLHIVKDEDYELQRGKVLIGLRELSPFINFCLWGGIIATAAALAAGKGPAMARGVVTTGHTIEQGLDRAQSYFR